jgi:hypothetical protein
MGDDSGPHIEVDVEGEERSEDDGGRRSRSPTAPHASIDWMAGFDEGRQRGGAEVLEALEAALVSVGVAPDAAKVIVERVRARADKPAR